VEVWPNTVSIPCQVARETGQRSALRKKTKAWADPAAMGQENLQDTLALLARILRSLGEKDAALVVFEDIDLVSGERGASPIRAWLSALDGVEQYRCRVVFLRLTNLSPREFDPAVVRPRASGTWWWSSAPRTGSDVGSSSPITSRAGWSRGSSISWPIAARASAGPRWSCRAVASAGPSRRRAATSGTGWRRW
jgi:hypothetical protein